MSTAAPPRIDPIRFVERVRDNESKLRRLRELELALIGAVSLREICQQTAGHFRRPDGDGDVLLTIADPDRVVETLMDSAGEEPSTVPDLQLLHERADLLRLRALGTAPQLLAGPGRQTRWLLPPRAPAYRSVVLLPLARHGAVFGTLGIASRDPARFAPGAATDFLAGFAAVYALCVESLLTRQKLELASTTDALTGLRNRRFLDARITEELARSARSGSPFSLMLLDIDHFKKVNDEHGHAMGDAVLRDVARRVSAVVRRVDIVCRYGGEEFAVLMPDTGAARAREVAERIRHAIAARSFPGQADAPLRITLSAGIATKAEPASGEALEVSGRSLCALADAALYGAKHAGRNRVMVAGEPDGR